MCNKHADGNEGYIIDFENGGYFLSRNNGKYVFELTGNVSKNELIDMAEAAHKAE